MKKIMRNYLEILTINETLEHELRLEREESMYSDLEESRNELMKLGFSQEDLEDFDY